MKQRLDYVKRIIEQEGLDGFSITSRPNTFYFTNFTGSTSKCLVTKNKAYLVVDFRYTIQAKEQVFPGIEVIQYDKSMNDSLNTLCQNDGVNKLGIEGEDVIFRI